MQKLEYFRPETLAEALDLLERHGESIRPYAGGTDLMVQLREGAKKLAATQYMMDLDKLAELKGIRMEGNVVSIGAMCSHTEVETSPVILAEAPCLARACSTVGSPQIRNMGTVGGNICNGSPAADSLSPFVALDTRLVIVSKNGERRELVKDMYERAGKLKFAPGELVTRLEFDRVPGYNTAFLKLGRRKALAISRMNAAVVLKLEDGKIHDARVVPGCVFATPDRLSAAERHVEGKAPSIALFEECGRLASEEMIARTGVRWSTEYKQPVVEALVRRALCEACGLEWE